MNQYPAIEICNLIKIYPGSDKAAVNRLSLSIPRGEIFGFLGPNGAGKSSTLNILCGLRDQTSGTILIDGEDLSKHRKEIRQRVGVVPQDIALYPTLTAYENLLLFGGVYGLRRKILDERIAFHLHAFGLTSSKNKQVQYFSGGMKRRINLIAGILHNPGILFLDEPTVGIDVQSKRVIIDTLKALNQQQTTMIYTSHSMDEAEEICTSLAMIDEGSVMEQGSPSELLKKHHDCRNLEEIYLKLTGKRLRD